MPLLSWSKVLQCAERNRPRSPQADVAARGIPEVRKGLFMYFCSWIGRSVCGCRELDAVMFVYSMSFCCFSCPFWAYFLSRNSWSDRSSLCVWLVWYFVREGVYFIFGHSFIMVYVPVLLGPVEVYVEVFYDPHDSRFIWSMMCHWSLCSVDLCPDVMQWDHWES